MQERSAIGKGAKDLNISITAYRALLILSLLMENSLTKDEIENALKNDPITAKSYSIDTIRVTLNTLKSVGCMISRPTSKNNYKYILFSHPFGFELTTEQIKCLATIRQNLVNLKDWQLVLNINELYRKIAYSTMNMHYIEAINNTEPMIDIDKNILKELIKYTANKNKITIEYKSPEHGLKDIELIADKIIYESNTLYLCCWSYEYQEYSYLRVDKIKFIKNVSKESHIINKKEYLATYIIKGDSLATYKPIEGESILEKTDEHVLIEAKVSNEFKFIQRLLLFGQDFILKSPDKLKKKLLEKLYLIKHGY